MQSVLSRIKSQSSEVLHSLLLVRKTLVGCLMIFFLQSGTAQDIYDIYRVRDLKLQFDDDNWANQLDSLKQLGNEDRLISKLTIDGMVYDSVGIRYKGNSSYYNVRKSKSSKLPFNIKLNYIKKKQLLKEGYKTLKLSNVFRDPSFMREVMSYEVARKYMPASRANFVRLYANDKLLGLYNLTESVDKNFLDNYFGWNDGILFKCDPNWDAKVIKSCPAGEKASLLYQGSDSLCYEGLYELKSDHGWKELIHLCKMLKEKPEEIDQYLNVDQTLWMHAFNNVLVNLDSYTGRLCHNYYLYQDSFGRFQPIVWDMNLSFGGFRFDGTKNSALSLEKLQKLSPFTHYKNDKRPLISKLLATSLYRKIYIAHIQTIIKDNFENDNFSKRVKQLQQNIDFYVKSDENKLYDYESFTQNADSSSKAGKSTIVGLNELMNARVAYLKGHPLLQKMPPRITEVQHKKKENQAYISAKFENATQAHLFYRYQKHAPFEQLLMKDDGASEDRSAGDSIYGAGIEWKPGIEYYIVGENEKTAALSPERAAFEYHEIKG